MPIKSAQRGRRRFGVSEQRASGVQPTLRITHAGECFNTGYLARGRIDERLEDGERLTVDHREVLSCMSGKRREVRRTVQLSKIAAIIVLLAAGDASRLGTLCRDLANHGGCQQSQAQ